MRSGRGLNEQLCQSALLIKFIISSQHGGDEEGQERQTASHHTQDINDR